MAYATPTWRCCQWLTGWQIVLFGFFPLPYWPLLVGPCILAGMEDASMIGLVACCKTKLAEPARAEELYCSPLFCKARAYCLARYRRWFILSAKYGLVDPGHVISPYNCTLLELDQKA